MSFKSYIDLEKSDQVSLRVYKIWVIQWILISLNQQYHNTLPILQKLNSSTDDSFNELLTPKTLRGITLFFWVIVALTFCDANFCKISGEMIIAEAQNVLLFTPVTSQKTGKSGVLTVTNFRLSFVTSEEKPVEVSHLNLNSPSLSEKSYFWVNTFTSYILLRILYIKRIFCWENMTYACPTLILYIYFLEIRKEDCCLANEFLIK